MTRRWVPLLLLVAGCSGSPTQPDRVTADRPFELAPGRSAVLRDGLRLRFDAVRSDSRCPMDALCVRAGEAVIAVTMTAAGEAAASRELETMPPRTQATYSRFTITLVDLQPYPRSDRPIRPEAYVATFSVQVR